MNLQPQNKTPSLVRFRRGAYAARVLRSAATAFMLLVACWLARGPEDAFSGGIQHVVLSAVSISLVSAIISLFALPVWSTRVLLTLLLAMLMLAAWEWRSILPSQSVALAELDGADVQALDYLSAALLGR